jgi:hypothetical protein
MGSHAIQRHFSITALVAAKKSAIFIFVQFNLKCVMERAPLGIVAWMRQ